MIKSNGKLQANPCRTTNSPDPSRMKIWVNTGGKEPQPIEVLAKAKGIQNGLEEVLINTSYDHVTSYKMITIMSNSSLFS